MAPQPPHSVSIVDGHYFVPGRGAAYLIQDGDEAAFVDNITRFSVPYMLEALKTRKLSPEQVRYLIVTHIHLDHSGGTAELLKHCPNATVLCHPRAEAHLIDPSKLIAGARAVHTAVYDQVYGVIEPVPAERVRVLQDSESVPLGNRTLTFLDTPGHARHHHAILDSATNMVYAGDAFGTCYQNMQGGPKPFVNYVCAPPTFEPGPARESIRKIISASPDLIGVTHFGLIHNIDQGAEQLLRLIDSFENVSKRAAETDHVDDDLLNFCVESCLDTIKEELIWSGLDPDHDETLTWACNELSVTSQGVSILAQKLRNG